MWRGTITPRKATALAVQLPAGAQIWVSVGSDLAWTSQTHLTAAVLDALNGANWQRGDGKSKKPDPTPRPSELAERAAVTDRHIERARRFQQRNREEG